MSREEAKEKAVEMVRRLAWLIDEEGCFSIPERELKEIAEALQD